MKHQLTILKSQGGHTMARCAAEAKKDAGAIAGAYRTLAYLFDTFQVSSAFYNIVLVLINLD
jgi:hypothetical protein